MFVNATKIYQFTAKNVEIKDYALYLGNISKDFTIYNLKNIIDFNPIDTNNILDIHKYLMKRAWYKIMFRLLKKILDY